MLSFHLHINMFSFHFHWLFDRRSTFDILTLKSNFNFILHHLFVTLDFSIPLKIFSHPLLTACSHMTSARRRRGETLLHSDFLCIFGKNLLIFFSLKKGKVEVKFICFYAGVICEWSLISLYHLLIHYFSQCDCYYLEMSTETAIPIFPIKNSTDKTHLWWRTRMQLYYSRIQTQMFYCELSEIFQNSHLAEHLSQANPESR